MPTTRITSRGEEPSESGAISQEAGNALIQGMSDAEFEKLLSIQGTAAQRTAANKARFGVSPPPPQSLLRQAPRRELTPAQIARNKAQQDRIDREFEESERLRVAKAEEANARRVAEGGEPKKVLPAATARARGVAPGADLTGIEGVPVVGPPGDFEQTFVGPSSPPAQARPLPPFVSALPVSDATGGLQNITGAEKAALLGQAGIQPVAEREAEARKRGGGITAKQKARADKSAAAAEVRAQNVARDTAAAQAAAAEAERIATLPATTQDITGAEKEAILSQMGIRPAPAGSPPVEVRTAEARVQVPGQEPPLSQMIATSKPQVRPEQKIQTIESGAGIPGGTTATGSRPLPWRSG